MKCPKCGFGDSAVVDSRPIKNAGLSIRRRRECLRCGNRFTTYEILGTQLEQINELIRQLEELT